MQTQVNQISASISGGLPQAGAQGGGQAGTVSTPQPTISIGGSTLSRSSGRGDDVITSGTDKGFQLYMAGLSQIQLGKYDEAKANMKRAIHLNKKIYDARTRLGLLEMRDANYDEARKQLLRLDKQKKRCADRCEDKTDIHTSTLILAQELAKI